MKLNRPLPAAAKAATLLLPLVLTLMAGGGAQAQTPPPAAAPPPPAAYDEALAARLGADDFGMRSYVLVILKTGPKPMPAGPERDAMFKGHFANIQRLAAEGKLVLAGPLDGTEGWRGLFVLATRDIEQAKAWAGADPVLAQGEMVAEYRRYYGSAALALIPEWHPRLQKKPM